MFLRNDGRKIFFIQRKSRLFAFGLVFCAIVYFYNYSYLEVDRKIIRELEQMIESEGSKLGCKQPNLPVFSPEILKFMEDIDPIDCSSAGTNWVTCEDFECLISQDIIMQKGHIECSFTDILRVDEWEFTDGGTTKIDSMDSKYEMKASDVVKIECHSLNFTESWTGVLTSTRYDQSIWDRTGWEYTYDDGLKMNVLMFAIDSISRNTMIRKLPKTYKYLTETLGALILEGYNIVGDGTVQALTPMLTGKTLLELPETRRRIKGANYVDVYPWVWNNFRNGGYVTAYLEESPKLGTFTYRHNGFESQPTDHYGRTYYLVAEEFFNNSSERCAGSTPQHKVMLDFVQNDYKSRPKFMFAFQVDLLHDDYNLVQAADDDYVDFLKGLYTSGALENTLLIAMADHGHRFGEIRDTMQGKIEERLPFFSFTFPPWFPTKHPQAYNNFIGNLKTLVTPFDIHATLESVLHLGNLGKANLSERSLSLFSQIPKGRGCAQAFIEPHWCACLDWEPVDLTNVVVDRLAEAFAETLNNYTSIVGKLCEHLTVASVIWVNKLKPNDNLLKFKVSKNYDDFEPDLTGTTHISSVSYQIKLKLSPGGGIFEATLTHTSNPDTISMKAEDISRVNAYGTQPWCIVATHPHLVKFCYCTKQN